MASELGVQTIQHTNGTDALTIDSSGRVLKPALPAFHAKNSSHTYITTDQIIVWNDVTSTACFNQGGHFSTSTSKFTAPVDGVYSFACQVYSNATTQCNVYWYVNDDQVASSQVNSNSGQANYEGIEMAVTLKLSANDTVYLKSGNGGYHQNLAYSYFCGHLVG